MVAASVSFNGASSSNRFGKSGLDINRAPKETKSATFRENERDHILRALEVTNWRIGGDGGAAKLLKIKRTTLNARMKKLNIQRKQ